MKMKIIESVLNYWRDWSIENQLLQFQITFSLGNGRDFFLRYRQLFLPNDVYSTTSNRFLFVL